MKCLDRSLGHDFDDAAIGRREHRVQQAGAHGADDGLGVAEDLDLIGQRDGVHRDPFEAERRERRENRVLVQEPSPLGGAPRNEDPSSPAAPAAG